MIAAASPGLKIKINYLLLGFLLAKSTHAPDAVGFYELGIARDSPAPAPIMTMGDLPNLCRAQWLADTADPMALLQSGAVDVSFIGGAQVDRFGNLNTSYIGGVETVQTRLPGSGGACDLACLAKRHIIVMTHEKRRFVARLVRLLKTLLLRRREGRRALPKRTEPSDFIIARSCPALGLLMREFSTVRNRRLPAVSSCRFIYAFRNRSGPPVPQPD